MSGLAPPLSHSLHELFPSLPSDVDPSFVSSVTPESRRKLPGRSGSGAPDNDFGDRTSRSAREHSLSLSYSEATSRDRGRRSPEQSPRDPLVAREKEEEEEEVERSQHGVDIPSSRVQETVDAGHDTVPSPRSLALQANLLERMALKEQSQRQSRPSSKSSKRKSHSREERLTQSLVVRGSQFGSLEGRREEGEWDDVVAQQTKVKKGKSKKKKRKKATDKGSPQASREQPVADDPSSVPEGEREEEATSRDTHELGSGGEIEEGKGGGVVAATASHSAALDEEFAPPSVTWATDTNSTALTGQLISGGEEEEEEVLPAISSVSPELTAEDVTDGGVASGEKQEKEEEVWEVEQGIQGTSPIRAMEGTSLEDELRQLESPRPRKDERTGELRTEDSSLPVASRPSPARQALSPTLEDFEIIDSDELYGGWMPVGKARGKEEEEEESSSVSPIAAVHYDGLPVRPKDVPEADKHAADIRYVRRGRQLNYPSILPSSPRSYDDNTRLVFQLDVFFKPDEQIERVSWVSVAMQCHFGPSHSPADPGDHAHWAVPTQDSIPPRYYRSCVSSQTRSAMFLHLPLDPFLLPTWPLPLDPSHLQRAQKAIIPEMLALNSPNLNTLWYVV